jgi:outer membrane protein assembly factor BamA
VEVDPPAGLANLDRYLNCNIKLSPLNKQSYTVELEGTNSSGIFGVAGNLNYSHKNLFRGAEIFDIGIKGGIEIGNSEYLSKVGTILELGVASNIRIPKFWLPFKTEQFIKRYSPKTNISLAYNFQRRPNYTRTIANTSFGYTWKGNRNITHIVNPIELNAVKLFEIDSAFMAEISANPYLKYSYEDHFVSVISYSVIYNNQKINKISDFQVIRVRLESAGNLLQAYNVITDKQTVDGQYQLFSLKYSQFFRGEFDFRYYMAINQTDRIVYRFFLGVGYPYGNSKAIPFEKAFYTGGFNSIRAWAPRTLGPGSYKLPETSTFPSSTADMKIEANAEYRFKLFWILEGALFADVGNIWAITENDTREGAQFHWNTFMNDMAVGLGLGLRFDFSFFIFSIDGGLKTRDPSYEGNQWFPYNPLTVNDFTVNVGIGYPF